MTVKTSSKQTHYTSVASESDAPDSSHKTGLSASVLRRLSMVSPHRTSAAIAFDWMVIVCCFVLSINFRHPAVWIVSAVVIAARQHALLILMHDGSHFRLLRNHGWNDRVSNWLCAWPLLVTTGGYRQNHLAHHSHLNTDDDPDWIRKYGHADWDFPKSRRDIVLLLLRELCGGGFLQALSSIRDLSGRKLNAGKNQGRKWERIAYYALAAVGISLFKMWVPVLLLWFLPAFTLLTVILRIRSIAEHFGIEGEHELNMSRNVHCRWWERFLLAPHNSGYHLDHHLYPSVPFYYLPELHAELMTVPAYSATSHQTYGFTPSSRSSFLEEITRDE
ncbi:MAG: fatty acid desaturase family protein [Planctomycetaceae bacterium]